MSNTGIQIIKAFFYLAFFSFFLLSCSGDSAPPVVMLKKSTAKKKIKTPPPQKKVFKKEFKVKKIGIFGSYARGDVYEGSDIDIVVELNNADLFLLVALRNYLQELFNCNVDIVRYRKRMNERLKQRIERDAIYV